MIQSSNGKEVITRERFAQDARFKSLEAKFHFQIKKTIAKKL